jgi:hypothetical protein
MLKEFSADAVHWWLPYLNMFGKVWEATYRYQCVIQTFLNWDFRGCVGACARWCQNMLHKFLKINCFYNYKADCDSPYTVQKVFRCKVYGWRKVSDSTIYWKEKSCTKFQCSNSTHIYLMTALYGWNMLYYTGAGQNNGNTKKLRNIICLCWLH